MGGHTAHGGYGGIWHGGLPGIWYPMGIWKLMDYVFCLRGQVCGVYGGIWVPVGCMGADGWGLWVPSGGLGWVHMDVHGPVEPIEQMVGPWDLVAWHTGR